MSSSDAQMLERMNRIGALQKFAQVEAQMMTLTPHDTTFALIDMAASITVVFREDKEKLRILLEDRLQIWEEARDR